MLSRRLQPGQTIEIHSLCLGKLSKRPVHFSAFLLHLMVISREASYTRYSVRYLLYLIHLLSILAFQVY